MGPRPPHFVRSDGVRPDDIQPDVRAPGISLGHRALLGAYGLAWGAAAPFLGLSGRMRKGFTQRLALGAWSPVKADIWIHGASGGEAMLARQIVEAMPPIPAPVHAKGPRHFTILCTTGTEQGMQVLEQASEWAWEQRTDIRILPRYLPLDMPWLMRRALRQARPGLVVLLETELWPGLLAACRRESVPVVMVNARLSTRSLAGNLALHRFYQGVAPERVLAISEPDAMRYAALLGRARVGQMPNMKFDRLAMDQAQVTPPPELAALVDPTVPFAVLGSVRQEEQTEVMALVHTLRQASPGASLGLFPKHPHLAPAWGEALKQAGLKPLVRSEMSGPAPAGSVILWDTFGELGAAYGLARAAFVGGSLKPLGGQNFLEPLARGVVPVIGPHWRNFAWVGGEIVEQGLVRQASDPRVLAESLLALLNNPPEKQEVLEKARVYVKARKGGTGKALELIDRYAPGRGKF